MFLSKLSAPVAVPTTSAFAFACPAGVVEQPDQIERDLSKDAPWKKIQLKIFKRWVNSHLAKADCSIDCLETDFSDGILLIALVEVLSGKTLSKPHIGRCLIRSQKFDNVSRALKFLEKSEKIVLVNIDSSDIVDCKLKLILGLVWHLILHYSISKPIWDGEVDADPAGCDVPTPKQRLLCWLQNHMPEYHVSNLTTDWNDARALGCLLNSRVPGLCPDWYCWSTCPKRALKNSQKALDLAHEWLGVSKLIKAEEITNPQIDEFSMMTYLSQFPNAKVKPGAGAPWTCPKPTEGQRNCKAFGPGLEKGYVKQSNDFTIDTTGAGPGALGLAIEGPSEAKMTCEDNHNGLWTVKYTVSEPGSYTIKVKFADKHIPGSPFQVPVVCKPIPGPTICVIPKPPPPPVVVCCNGQKPIPGPLVTVNKPRPSPCPTPPKHQTCDKGRRGPLNLSIIGLNKAPTVRNNSDGTYNVTCFPGKSTNLVATLTCKKGQGHHGGGNKVKFNSIVGVNHGEGHGYGLQFGQGVSDVIKDAQLQPQSPIPKEWLRDETAKSYGYQGMGLKVESQDRSKNYELSRCGTNSAKGKHHGDHSVLISVSIQCI